MLTETFQSISNATRSVLRNWRSMLLVAMVYAALLAALYLFISVREANLVQVALTFALAIAAPLLFFLLQAMIVGGVAAADEQSPASLIKQSLTGFWKLILVTLPLIALAVGIAYLLGKAQTRFGTSLPEAAADLPRRISTAASRPARPIDWRAAILSSVRYLTLGLVLPLLAIHFWLATASEGLGAAIRKIGTHLSRAFSPQSVLIYVVGFLIFGVVPYFLLFRTTSTRHAWLELFLLITRLAAIFALTLFGWVITVKAIALMSRNQRPASTEAS